MTQIRPGAPVSRSHMTISETASHLGVSIDTVRRWSAAGKLSAYRLDGRNRYFLRREVEHLRAMRPLSVSEVAKLLKVSPSTVRRLEARGELQGARAQGGGRQYSAATVAAYQNGLAQSLYKSYNVTPANKVKSSRTSAVSVQLAPKQKPDFHSVIPAPQVKKVTSEESASRVGWFTVAVCKEIEQIPIAKEIVHELKTVVPLSVRLQTVTAPLIVKSRRFANWFNGRRPENLGRDVARGLMIVAVTGSVLGLGMAGPDQQIRLSAAVLANNTSPVIGGASQESLILPSTFFLKPTASGLTIVPTAQVSTNAYATLPITPSEVASKSLTSEQIADGGIELVNLSPELQEMIKNRGGSGTQTITNAPATSADTDVSVIAGVGLSGTQGDNSLTLGINTGNTTRIVNNNLEVRLSAGVTTSTTSSGSGLEQTAAGLQLLGGCGTGQTLLWTGSAWSCATVGSGSSNLMVKEGGSTVTPNATALDFSATDFNVVDSSGQSQISIDYANSGLAKVNGAATISGNWSFNDSSFTLQDNGDATKKTVFQLSGIGTGTTRTLTVPNASGTIVTTGNLTDITSVGIITTGTWQGSTLAVQFGGTGGTTFTSNGLIYGNGTGALQATAAGTSGQLPIANGSGVPTFVSLGGDATLAASGALTLAASGVTANTYGSGTQVPVLAVDGKGRITSVTNTAISGTVFNTGTGLTGGATVAPGGTLNLGLATAQSFTTVAGTTSVTSPLFTNGNNLTVSATGPAHNLTLSATGNIILSGFNCSTYNNGGVLTTDASGNIICQNDDGGAAGSITGGGTGGKIAVYGGVGASTTLGDSILTQNGTTLEVDTGNNLKIVSGNLLTAATVRLTNAGALQNVTATNVDGVSFNADVLTSGTINNARLNGSVTVLGNTVNGVSSLVQTNASSQYPALNGSLITNLSAANLTGSINDARLSANVTVQGNTFNAASKLVQLNTSTQYPALDGSLITSLSAANLAGSINDARLSANVTVLGNTFNAASKLVQLNASTQYPALNGSLITNLTSGNLTGALPALDGSALTNLSAANLAGTINNARLNGSVTVLGNTVNGVSSLVQTNASSQYPALDGSLITALSAANLAGTINDARLSANVTVQGNTFNAASKLVQLNATSQYPALDGSLITSLSAANLSGTINNARLNGSVTVLGNTVNGVSSLVQTNASSQYPALDGSLITSLSAANLSGTISNTRLNANVTILGNTVNGASSLVQTNASSQYPALNGSLITSLTSGNLTGALPALDGSALTSLSAANLAGTINNARLSGSVTLLGNTVNGVSSLVQTNASNQYPALDGSLITSLSAANLAGSINDARLSANVTVQGNTFNAASKLVQLNASTQYPALDGSLITSLSAANLSGTINNARLAASVTVQGNTFNGVSQLVQTTAAGKYPALDGSLITGITSTTLGGQPGSYYLDNANATGTLTTDKGGTGLTSFTANGVVFASSTSALSQITGTSGQLIIAGGTGIPAFVSASGDVTISASGVTTIGASKVTNAMLANSSVTVTAGTGLTGGGAVSLGGSSTGLSVVYGSGANSAAAGSNTFTCSSGTGNLSGGGATVTLGTTGTSCGTISITNTPTFSGLSTFSNTGATAVTASGAPAGSASGTLIQLGSGITNGSANGTFLSVNQGVSGTADFLNLEVNNVSKLSVTSAGALTAAGQVTAVGVNGGTGSIQGTGGLSITGASTISGTLGSVTNFTLSGTISGGTTVTGSGNFNSTGGSLQTNTTTRVDNSGNLTNIGNFTATAGSTFATTGSNGFIFKPGTDNATAFRIQNAAGTLDLFNVNSTSSIITVKGTTTTFANLTISEAHIKATQTTAPTIGTPATCGLTPTATVSANSGDSAGSFFITSSAGTTGVCTTVITFNKAYATAPKTIILTADNSLGGTLPTTILSGVVTAKTTTTFTVQLSATCANTATQYGFDYWVIE